MGLNDFPNVIEYVQEKKKNEQQKNKDTTGLTCAKCGSEFVFKTNNPQYSDIRPFNCINCGLLTEKEAFK